MYSNRNTQTKQCKKTPHRRHLSILSTLSISSKRRKKCIFESVRPSYWQKLKEQKRINAYYKYLTPTQYIALVRLVLK